MRKMFDAMDAITALNGNTQTRFGSDDDAEDDAALLNFLKAIWLARRKRADDKAMNTDITVAKKSVKTVVTPLSSNQ